MNAEAVARELESRLLRAKRAAERQFVAEVRRVANEAIEAAPVDTGKLRESCQVTINGLVVGKGSKSALINVGTIPSDPMTAVIAFVAAHAITQHEKLDLRHPRGGPKFLERAVAAFDPDIIAQKTSQALGS